LSSRAGDEPGGACPFNQRPGEERGSGDEGDGASERRLRRLHFPSPSSRIEGYFEETKTPLIKPNEKVEMHLLSGAPALRGPSAASALES
jgi:hypothetical protein